jgi:hypothetical protein
MTTPSDGGAERRKPRLANAQLRSDRIHRHRHDLFDTAAPADPILGPVVKLPNSRSKCRGQTPRLDVSREPLISALIDAGEPLREPWVLLLQDRSGTATESVPSNNRT